MFQTSPSGKFENRNNLLLYPTIDYFVELRFFLPCPPTHPQKDPHWKCLCDGIFSKELSEIADVHYIFPTKNPLFAGLPSNTGCLAIAALWIAVG
jgi:hypothetical protein